MSLGILEVTTVTCGNRTITYNPSGAVRKRVVEVYPDGERLYASFGELHDHPEMRCDIWVPGCDDEPAWIGTAVAGAALVSVHIPQKFRKGLSWVEIAAWLDGLDRHGRVRN